MILKLAFLKMTRPNQTTWTAAVTSYLQTPNVEILPLGGAGTAAPSTIVIDRDSRYGYYLNLPYSTSNARLSAATSSNDVVVLI